MKHVFWLKVVLSFKSGVQCLETESKIVYYFSTLIKTCGSNPFRVRSHFIFSLDKLFCNIQTLKIISIKVKPLESLNGIWSAPISSIAG